MVAAKDSEIWRRAERLVPAVPDRSAPTHVLYVCIGQGNLCSVG